MLQVTDYVMRFAPFAVFAAVGAADRRARAGDPRHLRQVRRQLLSRARAAVGAADRRCFVIVGARAPSSGSLHSRADRARFLDRIVARPPIRARWRRSTGSACRRRIASFVLPLGYSFNLDGSMMYMTFATIFIAQAYGIDLSLGQQITCCWC